MSVVGWGVEGGGGGGGSGGACICIHAHTCVSACLQVPLCLHIRFLSEYVCFPSFSHSMMMMF